VELKEPAGIEVVLFPVGIGDAVLADEAPGARGVDELVVADIDADVGILFALLNKEQKVALPGVLEAHGTSAVLERARAVRDVHSGGKVAVSHQAAAVEPGGHIALELVGPPDHGKRRIRRLVACGCRVAGNVLRRCRGTTGEEKPSDTQYE